MKRERGTKPIYKTELDMLLASLEYRGADATGVALMNHKGEISVLKDNEGAWKFISSKGYMDFIEEHLTDDIEVAILHTRKATKGNPFKNENNHPMYMGAGAIVHNGMISNDDSLFSDLKLERSCECDSDIIRAIVDKDGLTKKAMERCNRISGSVAAACIHPKFPGTVMLLRSGNPLVVASYRDKLVWASDKRAIYSASKPFVKRWGLTMQMSQPDIAFINMHDDSGWLIGPKGLDFHGEFKASGGWSRSTTYNVHTVDYSSRRKRFEDAAKPVEVAAESAVEKKGPPPFSATQPVRLLPKYVYCPNAECKTNEKPTLIKLGEEARRLRLFNLTCGVCDRNLALAMAHPHQLAN